MKEVKKKRHVLGEGWTRYQLDFDMETAQTIWLVEEKELRAYQASVPLKPQLWDKKVRLVLEEI